MKYPTTITQLNQAATVSFVTNKQQQQQQQQQTEHTTTAYYDDILILLVHRWRGWGWVCGRCFNLTRPTNIFLHVSHQSHQSIRAIRADREEVHHCWCNVN
jgi:hypothetical protein